MADPRRFRFGIELHTVARGTDGEQQACTAGPLAGALACIGGSTVIVERAQEPCERCEGSHLVPHGDTTEPLAPIVAALGGT